MIKNILLPTDGTEFCEKAIRYGVSLAKVAGGKVTGVTVMSPETQALRGHLSVETLAAIQQQKATHAKAALNTIAQIAQEAGVPCETVVVEDERAYEGIVKAGREKQCDLIVMASHGRRGLTGILIGSETQKVLAQSDLPVLVFRGK